MQPKSIDDTSLDEFFRLYALAEYARELKLKDIEVGVANGISTAWGGDDT